jgi:small neutral amino acid transporter SnatA (MarC family)
MPRSGRRELDVRAAMIAAVVLALGSLALLGVASEPTGAFAVAGGIGLVIAGSLMGLTFLARRWERHRVRYVQTAVGEQLAVEAASPAVAGDERMQVG